MSHHEYFAIAVRDARTAFDRPADDRTWPEDASPADLEAPEPTCAWCGDPLPLGEDGPYCGTACSVQAEMDGDE